MKAMNLNEAIYQAGLSLPRTHLMEYSSRNYCAIRQDVWDKLSERKQFAVSANDQLTATAVWCLEQIGRAQDSFVTAYKSLFEGAYKEAWEQLVQCENTIRSLDGHFTEEENQFGIEHIRKHATQFQELFPLSMGVSPGLLIKEARCSICDSKLTLRNGCAHEIGKIYDGEECIKVVTKWELLHVALVSNPAQKSTMIFPPEDKNHIFVRLQELAQRLGRPWRRWNLTKEERRSHHPAFKGIGRNETCPCGSALKYKKCCLMKEKVYPHFLISVSTQ